MSHFTCTTDLLKFEVKKPPKIHQALRFSTILPFIKPVKVLQVSSKGKQYHDISLGLCINIPEGAVPEGCLLQLEVGMCLHGPFKFPDNQYPISPILMLCPQTDIKLNRSIKVTLPHVMTNESVGTLGIQVIKADHAGLIFGDTCSFDHIFGDSSHLAHIKDGKGYITFSLQHFCFVALRTASTCGEAERAGYCLCPLFSSQSNILLPNNFTFYLCVTYFMDACFEVMIFCILLCMYSHNRILL